MRKITVFNFVTLNGFFEGLKRISAGIGTTQKKINMLLRVSSREARFFLDA